MRGKNIVFYVTRQYMKKNRCRTATTFAGIVLMVLLMTCVFIGRDTGVKYLEALASQKNGRYHASVYDISETEYQEILRLPYVKQTAASAGLGSTVFELSANEERPYLNIKGYTKNCYEWMNISLAEGRLPENESEIAVSRSAVEDGSSMKLGDRIDAEFFERSITGIGRDGGTTYFPFSGLSIQSGDTMDVPENFPYYGENDSFQENHRYTGEQKQYEIVGIIEPPAYESGVAAGYTALTTLTTEQVLGRDSFNLSVIFDQELLPDTYFQDWEKMFPDCEVETNDLLLAFSADSSDTTINLVVRYMTVLFTLLIMAVSVVLIYNVFHMSFRERSRYLGMLCSVGATGRQKRSSIYYEACYLLLLGLPLGIFPAAAWAAVGDIPWDRSGLDRNDGIPAAAGAVYEYWLWGRDACCAGSDFHKKSGCGVCFEYPDGLTVRISSGEKDRKDRSDREYKGKYRTKKPYLQDEQAGDRAAWCAGTFGMEYSEPAQPEDTVRSACGSRFSGPSCGHSVWVRKSASGNGKEAAVWRASHEPGEL